METNTSAGKASPWVIIGSLVGFSLVGLLVAGLVSVPLAGLADGNILAGEFSGDSDRILFMLVVGMSNFLPFLAPVLAAAWFFRIPLSGYFGPSGPAPWHHFLASVGVLTCIPAFSWMIIPGSLSQQYQLLMDAGETGNPAFWILMWLMIGILPAVSEELYFRGILQGELEKKIGRALSVAGTAIVFALIHFDINGLIVRLCLGFILGYTAARTRSLWPGAIIHAVNNSSQVLLLFLSYKGILPEEFSDPDYRFGPGLAVTSLVVTTLIAWAWLRITPNRPTPNPDFHV